MSNAKTAKRASTGATIHESTVEVYSPSFKGILLIPSRHVFHTPAPSLRVTRLVLCSKFFPEDPYSCPMGSRCKFVHADTSEAREHDVHVNYAWRSLADVTYETYSETDGMIDAAPPNGTVAEKRFPAPYVLRTRALVGNRNRLLSQCAHFAFSGTCHRGSKCNFIHAVYIDPEARRFQRAPIPSRPSKPQSHFIDIRPIAGNALKEKGCDAVQKTSSVMELGTQLDGSMRTTTTADASDSSSSHESTMSRTSYYNNGERTVRFRYDPYKLSGIALC